MLTHRWYSLIANVGLLPGPSRHTGLFIGILHYQREIPSHLLVPPSREKGLFLSDNLPHGDRAGIALSLRCVHIDEKLLASSMTLPGASGRSPDPRAWRRRDTPAAGGL